MSSQNDSSTRKRSTDVPSQTNDDNARPNGAPEGQQQQEQQPEQTFGIGTIVQLLFRFMIMYYIYQWMFNGSKTPVTTPPPGFVPDTEGTKQFSQFTHAAPLWPSDSSMDLRVYISEDEEFMNFNDPKFLVWHVSHIRLGDWDNEKETALELQTSANVRRNGTLYAHVYLTLNRASPNPLDPGFQPDMRVYQRKLLTRYYPKRKEVKTRKLLSGGESEEAEEKDVDDTESSDKDTPIISHWHQNLTINIVSDSTIIPYASIPSHISSLIPLESTGMTDPSGRTGYYLPVVLVNDFWLLREQMMPINETVKTLPLNIKYYPISFFKFQLYIQMEESFRIQAGFIGGDAHAEFDEIKRMFSETSPILLGVTMIVSILHSVFEFLAFKNDIAHWKDIKEMTGVSVRTIFLNIFFQLVIFLYLMDNNRDTSWMILIGQGIGLAIEVWKVKKAVDVEIKAAPTKWYRYSVRLVDKHKLSESEQKTKEYDRLAFKYLSWAAYPLLAGYAVYSLIYNTHKSWYSFILTTLVGFVYAFGFIMMTPQLFINYKLKSVAHMPWKTLMYKTLGTFVDDLFAFCIKMPTLHRLACLRDDVVFFVYIYQRWIYPVDETRANEYGQVGEGAKKITSEKKTQ
ncbi:2965_t:CDS:10 [Paraglomus occultum]|uniref:2965_t:CDS:1 n=1 Tax=Paraglomus occultum TaxID=144539 RepID=A0A9N8WKM0_9GLOM|nr:2965_t:CDS:10 [Paraglomus occultum]